MIKKDLRIRRNEPCRAVSINKNGLLLVWFVIDLDHDAIHPLHGRFACLGIDRIHNAPDGAFPILPGLPVRQALISLRVDHSLAIILQELRRDGADMVQPHEPLSGSIFSLNALKDHICEFAVSPCRQDTRRPFCGHTSPPSPGSRPDSEASPQVVCNKNPRFPSRPNCPPSRNGESYLLSC